MWDLSVLVFLLLFHISLKMEMKSISFQTSDEISQKNPWLLNERRFIEWVDGGWRLRVNSRTTITPLLSF